MTLQGPYVDGAWMNKPSKTIFLCVECANDRELSEEHALFYSDMPDYDHLECNDCGTMIREVSHE